MKIQKILQTFGAISAIATPIVSVVACNKKVYKRETFQHYKDYLKSIGYSDEEVKTISMSPLYEWTKIENSDIHHLVIDELYKDTKPSENGEVDYNFDDTLNKLAFFGVPVKPNVRWRNGDKLIIPDNPSLIIHKELLLKDVKINDAAINLLRGKNLTNITFINVTVDKDVNLNLLEILKPATWIPRIVFANSEIPMEFKIPEYFFEDGLNNHIHVMNGTFQNSTFPIGYIIPEYYNEEARRAMASRRINGKGSHWNMTEGNTDIPQAGAILVAGDYATPRKHA